MADFTAVDFMLAKDAEGIFDLVVQDGTIQAIDSFDTCLLMIFFCERRADESEIPLPQYRRGWWGNSLLSETDFEIGSKFYLLYQERCTQDVLNKGISYLREASQWLIDDGHLKTLTISGAFEGQDGIAITIDYVTLDGKVDSRYYKLWKNTGKPPIIKTRANSPDLLLEVGSQIVGHLTTEFGENISLHP